MTCAIPANQDTIGRNSALTDAQIGGSLISVIIWSVGALTILHATGLLVGDTM